MSARKPVRYGAYAHNDTIETIDALCKEHDVSRAALLEVIVVGATHQNTPIPTEALTRAIELGKESLGMQKKEARKERERLISVLKGIPTDDLAKLVSTVKPAEG